MRNGTLSVRGKWERLTDETDFSSSPGLPTPIASDGTKAPNDSLARTIETGSRRGRKWPTPKGSPSGPDFARPGRDGSGGDDLATAVARGNWPTPTAGDCRGSGSAAYSTESGRHSGTTLTDAAVRAGHHGGQLNPTWVEWLMGFPSGWTAYAASATGSCPKSPTSSGDAS
jgi:hypothetical protein